MFNTITDKWIPTDKGKYGIYELLENAHELKEIKGGNPLNEFSLYRFMFAFLMDALQIETPSERRNLLKSGKFDMDKVSAYIKLCEGEGVSFDIFDPERPFLQTKLSVFTNEDIKSIGSIDTIRPTATNKRFFDKTYESEIEMSDAEIAQYLVTPTVHPGEGNGYTTCISGVPVYAIIKGKNLFETLVYGIIPKDSTNGRPYGKPSWRVDYIETTKQKPHIEPDFLYALTLPIRAMRVIDNKTMYYKGRFYHSAPTWKDPYVPYFDKGKGKFVYMQPSKEFYKRWVDLLALSDGTTNALTVVTLYNTYRRDKNPLNIVLYDCLVSNSRYSNMSRSDDFFLPSEYLENKELMNRIRILATRSDAVSGHLKRALRSVFETITPELITYGLAEFHEQCDKAFTKRINAINTEEASWIDELEEMAKKSFDDMTKTRLRTDQMITALKTRNLMVGSIRKMKG